MKSSNNFTKKVPISENHVKNQTSQNITKNEDTKKKIEEVDQVIEKYMNMNWDSKNFNDSQSGSGVAFRKQSANKKKYLATF